MRPWTTYAVAALLIAVASLNAAAFPNGPFTKEAEARALFPNSVEDQVRYLDPELASIIDWAPKKVAPGVVPLTAEDYISERQTRIDRYNREHRTWWQDLTQDIVSAISSRN